MKVAFFKDIECGVLKTAQKYYYYLVFRHTYVSIDGCEVNLACFKN